MISHDFPQNQTPILHQKNYSKLQKVLQSTPKITNIREIFAEISPRFLQIKWKKKIIKTELIISRV